MNEVANNQVAARGAAGREVEDFKRRILEHLTHTVGKDHATASLRDWYEATARTVRDRLVERWLETYRTTYGRDLKRVYYLSMEFLIGRSLINNLVNLGQYETCLGALRSLGLDLDRLAVLEPEAALGNGGLGRLAACLMDAMATVGIPGYGYGIRYDFGMFRQGFENGWQVELPDHWLRYGNHWEFPRPEFQFPVRFFGRLVEFRDDTGHVHHRWTDTEDVMAMAFDQLVPGYGGETVANIRLWAARSGRGFDLQRFNQGDYLEAVRSQAESESLSRVLYPDDSTAMGKALRLKQEYFFTSASLQDIVRRFLFTHSSLKQLPEKVAIQLNDTHPSIGIAEMMRILLDDYGLKWDDAWAVTVGTFSYTNHTLMPEALETWPVDLIGHMLPRILQIIFEINHRFLVDVRRRYPEDHELVKRASLVDESEGRKVRMANLAFVGSHRVNGVAAIHTELMKSTVFSDLHRLFPQRIVNKTNGITPRRWLLHANRGLANLITEHIGDGWISDLSRLKALEPLAQDERFQEEFRAVKRENKERLARYTREIHGTALDVGGMFDVHVKRMHEYKRQLLNLLHVVTRYNRIRANPSLDIVPRVAVFAGKAAPGYYMAKLIIKLINDVGAFINNDPVMRGRLAVVLLPDYNVSSAEVIIPAAELSEQISTAGTEASGTGNMKLALNGALTVGTRDGANIEIGEEVGQDNLFFFGLTADEVAAARSGNHEPWRYVENNPELRRVLDMVGRGYFSPDEPDRFRPVVESLTTFGDYFLLLADYGPYIACQDRIDAIYRRPFEWTRRAILNVARIGKFTADRTVREYATDIWNVAAQPPARPIAGAQ